MVQRDKYTYDVKKGEIVTLAFELRNLPANSVSVSEPWERGTGTEHPKFEYTIPMFEVQKVYNALCEVSFVMSPPGAQAKITVEGSEGGGSYDVVTVTANSPDKDPGITFWVRS